jgi:hypothetical protein
VPGRGIPEPGNIPGPRAVLLCTAATRDADEVQSKEEDKEFSPSCVAPPGADVGLVRVRSALLRREGDLISRLCSLCSSVYKVVARRWGTLLRQELLSTKCLHPAF